MRLSPDLHATLWLLRHFHGVPPPRFLRRINHTLDAWEQMVCVTRSRVRHMTQQSRRAADRVGAPFRLAGKGGPLFLVPGSACATETRILCVEQDRPLRVLVYRTDNREDREENGNIPIPTDLWCQYARIAQAQKDTCEHHKTVVACYLSLFVCEHPPAELDSPDSVPESIPVSIQTVIQTPVGTWLVRNSAEIHPSDLFQLVAISRKGNT